MCRVSAANPTSIHSAAILYELLAGRPPFLGATVLDTLHLIREREPVPPRHLQPSTPCDLETICLKCLNKEPMHRYATALALAEDLQRFLAGTPIVARRAGPVERLGRLMKRKPAASIAVALFVLLMIVALMAIWTTDQQRQRLSAAALVDSVATADVLALPEMMGRIQAQGSSILPQVRAALAVAAPPESKWVNLAIAELVADPTAACDRLLEYLPTARPAEIALLVQTLATRPDVVAERVWPMLLDDSVTDEPRLRLACLAARISPNDLRWSDIAADVAGALVRQHPLDVGALSAALSPARTSLIPALVKLSRDPQLEPRAKLATTGILARYAADQPTILVDLISEAPPEEFRLLLPPLHLHAEIALPLLQSVADSAVSLEELSAHRSGRTKSDIESAYDAAVHKQANALIAIWHLDNAEAVLPALRRQGNPALRSHLIHWLAPLGIPVDELWQHAQNSTDSGVRQSLILALGQAPLKGMKLSSRKVLADDLLAFYRSDADAGVHSACDWLLRTQLDCESAVQESTDRQNAKLSSDRGWYVGPNQHVFSVFRGRITYKMGSPVGELTRESDEDLHEEYLNYSFAMSTKEVTIAQFNRFNPNSNTNRAYSPTNDCPENDVSWFETAAYCRWLSEQEGLPEEEMCYPPIPQIVPGVRLPENWKTRTGYRLPTSAEWEYACRGGVGAAQFWGDGEQLAIQYAWCLRNSDDHAWPVGLLKPNNFGMFDMLGNISERCNNPMRPYSSEQDAVSEHNEVDEDLIVGADVRQELRGGNFGDGFHNLRSARRFSNSAQDEWASVGFRVARTLTSQ